MHPRTTDRVRNFLAKNSFIRLIVLYLILIVLISFVLGILYHLTSVESSVGVMNWWLFAFLQLFDASTPNLQFSNNSSGLQISVLIIGEILKIILPALFLGGLIFKLFIVPRVFTFRNKCSIYKRTQEGKEEWVLAVRLYSSTSLEILDLNFSVYARLPRQRVTGENYTLNVQLQTRNSSWPLAALHIPFTIYIPLNDNDIYELDQTKRLLSIQGHKFGEELNLLILVSGTTPELGTEFIEHYWYVIPAQSHWGKFQDIAVDYSGNTPPHHWVGWKDFDHYRG